MGAESKVVITGMNIITSLGLNLNENWKNLTAGKSGVKRITLFDPSNLQTQIAAQLPEGSEKFFDSMIKKRSSEQMTRVTKMCYACTSGAVEDNNINFDNFDKTRCAVILGIVNTGDKNYSKEENIKNRIVKGMNNAVSAWISLKYKLEGPNFTVSTACASSAYAIAMAYDYIKYDKADIVIAGGADSVINPYEIEGFNEIFALSTRNNEPEKASKPFTKDRDGFVIGEGSGILIIESEKSAKARNAKIYAELAGYGISSESYHMMAPMSNGEGMIKTMELAIKNSGISKEEVDISMLTARQPL
jgi:3-oxoacyl-[acyl-carrier-protein] synthase II